MHYQKVQQSPLDFDQQKDASQVVIGLQNVSEYKDNKPRPDTITVDVPGAFVPKSLSRFGYV